MNISFSIKERIDGSWKDVDLNDLAGRKLQAVFKDYAGREVVAEFIFGDAKVYFCGTEKWLNEMKNKGGNAVAFSELPLILKKKGKLDILNEVWPMADDVVDIFGGGEHINTKIEEQN
jgi:hypothetical protein